MEFYIVPLDNFQINEDSELQDIKLDNHTAFTISKDNKVIGQSIDTNYLKNLGGLSAKHLLESTCSFSTLNRDYPVTYNKKNEYLHMLYALNQLFAMGLWIVKDNSVNIPFAVYNNDKSDDSIIVRKNVMVSNSKGRYTLKLFNLEELEYANQWMNIFWDYMPTSESNSTRQYLLYNDLKSDLSQNVSSFERAMLYLQVARSESFLPSKIASYISVLETLFAVNGENTYKTAERAAIFIGKDLEERYNIYNKVSTAYKVRSSYVHGSNIKESLNKTLETISSDIDGIVRLIIVSFFTNYKELNYSKQSGFDDVNSWFIKKVLE